MAYLIVWRFEVHPDHIAAFESAYGPDGDWARLFRTQPGFLAVELVRDRSHPAQYVTIDRWQSAALYRAMRQTLAAEYARLDAACADFTIREEEIGEFDAIDVR